MTASVDSSVVAVDIAKRGVTVSVENASLPYNGTEQSGKTKCTFTGLLSGHTASIAYTPATGANASATPYEGSFGDLKVVDGNNVNVTANYKLTSQTPGMLTITKAPVTITVPSDEKYYGTADPTFANASMSGQVNGELTDVSLAVSRSDAAKANAGYDVVVRYSKYGKVVAFKTVKAGKTSATIKGLKSGKKVWVQVRPLREAGKTTYSGMLTSSKASVVKVADKPGVKGRSTGSQATGKTLKAA